MRDSDRTSAGPGDRFARLAGGLPSQISKPEPKHRTTTMTFFARQARRHTRVRSIRRRCHLGLEHLESRLVLSTLTVNTLTDTVDSNPALTSLREAITDANSQAGDD